MSTKTASASPTHTTPSAGSSLGGASWRGSSVQLKRVLSDKTLDVQMSMLTPRARSAPEGDDAGGHQTSATPPGEGEAVEAPVQRKQERTIHREPVQAKASADPVQRVETTPITGGNAPPGAEVNLTGQSMSAPSADNPNFEQDAINFERALGGAAMTRASSIATALCGKAMTYLRAKVQSTLTATEDLKTKLDELLVKVNQRDESFAGAVPGNGAVIRFIASDVAERARIVEEARTAGQSIAMFQTPPNVREQMTFLYNVGARVLGPDLIKDGAAKVSNLLGATATEKSALEAKQAEIRQLAAERSAAATDPTSREANPNAGLGDAIWGVPNRPPPGAGGDAPTGRSGTISGDTTAGGGTAPIPAAADTTRAVRGQGNARVNYADVNNATGASHTTASTRPADTLAPGAQISEREQAHMQIGPTDILKWSEGDKMWFINEKDTWVKAIRELGLPLGGGPSGTTTAIMNTNEILSGGSADNARLCAIGYLLPIHAHTLVEILAAASAFGSSFTAGRQMYTNISPFSEQQLRDLGRDNPQKRNDPRRPKLFPHEATPPPPAPAVASGGAGATAPSGGAPAAPAPASGATTPPASGR